MSFIRSVLPAFLCLSMLSPSLAQEQTELIACEKVKKGRKAKLVKDGAAYITVITLLEEQGRGNLSPEFDVVAGLCLADTLERGEVSANIKYAGFTKGLQTLLYDIDIREGEIDRKIYVVYSGFLSFAGYAEQGFYVAEVAGDRVDIHAIYDREPPLKQMKALLDDILAGRPGPIISAEWQDGEDEMIITIFDGDRLD